MNTTLAALPEGAAYDVVVIGAGGAGMAAALFAAIDGLKVLLVERTEFVGGTTAFSAATTWVPNTRHATPGEDSPEKVARFLDQVVGNHAPRALRQAFLAAGPAAIATLEDQSDVQFRPFALHPDYEQEAEGATLRGRAIEPLPFDGRELGEAFSLVRPPIPEFTLFGKLMIDRIDIGHLLNAKKSFASFRHALQLVGRYAKDRLRYSRGTRLVMGNALVGRLLLSLIKRGVGIVTQAEVIGFIHEGDAVRGIVLESDGKRRNVGATKGVVLASGGFNRHPALRAALLPQPTPVYSPAAPGHTGRMHDLALDIGARHDTTGRSNAFWAPVSVRQRPDGSTAVFPHFVMDRGKPGMIAVNAAGQRFVNESTSYHQFGLAMFESNGPSPSIPAYLIGDSTAVRKYGMGMVRPGAAGLASFLADGYLTESATLRDLAEKLGIDADGLEKSVATLNGYARTGVDPDFHRGSTPYHRVNGDPNHGPNPNIGLIETGPFYAVKLYPGDIGASAGLLTDERARVLDAQDRPIPGLYACGNDARSIMGGTYPGPGITIGPGLTFAYIATRDIAGQALERAAA